MIKLTPEQLLELRDDLIDFKCLDALTTEEEDYIAESVERLEADELLHLLEPYTGVIMNIEDYLNGKN